MSPMALFRCPPSKTIILVRSHRRNISKRHLLKSQVFVIEVKNLLNYANIDWLHLVTVYPCTRRINGLHVPVVSRISAPIIPFFIIGVIRRRTRNRVIFQLKSIIQRRTSHIGECFELFNHLLQFFLRVRSREKNLVIRSDWDFTNDLTADRPQIIFQYRKTVGAVQCDQKFIVNISKAALYYNILCCRFVINQITHVRFTDVFFYIHRRYFSNSFSRLRRQITENQKSQNRSQKQYKNTKQGKEPYQVILTAFSVHMVRSRFFHNDTPLLELPKFAMQ